MRSTDIPFDFFVPQIRNAMSLPCRVRKMCVLFVKSKQEVTCPHPRNGKVLKFRENMPETLMEEKDTKSLLHHHWIDVMKEVETGQHDRDDHDDHDADNTEGDTGEVSGLPNLESILDANTVVVERKFISVWFQVVT